MIMAADFRMKVLKAVLSEFRLLIATKAKQRRSSKKLHQKTVNNRL